MRGSSTPLRTGLHVFAAGILLVGLLSAVLIYLTAEDPSESTAMYDFHHSKKYRHDVEAYGGKMTVVANELVRWFESLFQGKSLAVTITCLSIALSSVIFRCCTPLAVQHRIWARG
jgi:hypothetical protein